MSDIYDPIFKCMSDFDYSFDGEYFSDVSDITFLKFIKRISGKMIDINIYMDGSGYITSFFTWDDNLDGLLSEIKESINRELNLKKVLDEK